MIKVLIVDDDIATAEVIKANVHWERYGVTTVETAYDVASAKAVLNDMAIDIIISDIEMPRDTGLDLLQWIRETNYICEFLFLTCHENFSYAADAISYEAAAYLTKPFDLDIMEMTLQKIIVKLMERRSLKENSEYGIWLKKNVRLMQLDFWRNVLDGNSITEKKIAQEIKERNLPLNPSHLYRLVVTRISGFDSDIEKFEKSVFEFILEGFHSEIIAQVIENKQVIKKYSGENLYFITVCQDETPEELVQRCHKLLEICSQYFKATVTCCISKSCQIVEMAEAGRRIEQIFKYNISYFGKVFEEEEAKLPAEYNEQVLDPEVLLRMVEKKDKTGILRYLKKVFDELSNCCNLNEHTLYLIKQEVIQVVYTDLMKQGIQASKLFYDEISMKIAERALESTMDMIRWVNYLLEKTFEYEEQIMKSATIIERINAYIHVHYAEDISRNEIAGEFFLTPEYLAKLYKKKTGVNIKDYINQYRIERAKEFLRAGEHNVSHVAEKVGFDNYSYFSTVFKKLAGVSPKEYGNK